MDNKVEKSELDENDKGYVAVKIDESKYILRPKAKSRQPKIKTIIRTVPSRCFAEADAV